MNSADDIVAGGDKVVVRYRAEGTHTGPFRGIAPTGKRVVIKGVEIHRVEQGKIAEAWNWSFADTPGWLTQLGVTTAAPMK